MYTPKYGKKIEHAIVRLLVRELAKSGFKPHSVSDGEDYPSTKTLGEVLDNVFAVDDATLRFTNDDGETLHGVLLIGGNGEDIISDWSYSEGDPDGFNKAMDGVLDRINEGRIYR